MLRFTEYQKLTSLNMQISRPFMSQFPFVSWSPCTNPLNCQIYVCHMQLCGLLSFHCRESDDNKSDTRRKSCWIFLILRFECSETEWLNPHKGKCLEYRWITSNYIFLSKLKCVGRRPKNSTASMAIFIKGAQKKRFSTVWLHFWWYIHKFFYHFTLYFRLVLENFL